MTTIARRQIAPVSLCVLVAAMAAHAGAQERPLRRISIPALVTTAAFSPEGERLLAWDPAGWSGWDAASGRQQKREAVIAKACSRASTFPRSEDGRVVGVHCRNRVLFFEAATGRALGERPLADKQTAAMYTAATSGATTAIVMAGATSTVLVGAMAGGGAATDLRIDGEIEQLTLSADGTRLSVGTPAGVEVRELPGGAPLRTFEGRAAHALAADGRRLAVIADGGAKLFDVETGQMLRQVEGRASHLRFSPDGRLLVGWTNQRLIVWDVASGAQRLALTGDEFVAGAVSPDGTRLATVGLDRRGEQTTSIIAVWQLPSSVK